MKASIKMCACIAAGFLLTAAPVWSAGDLTIRVLDMNGQVISGTRGGSATLRGLDAKGLKNIGPRAADNAGLVVFKQQEIMAQMQLPLRFNIETGGGNSAIRALLYDPFGYNYSFIEYQTNQSYAFDIPTPVNGQQSPTIAWNGANSQMKFQIDLGGRSSSDFWVIRAVWQKKAPSIQFADLKNGLIPVLSGKWLTNHSYTVDSGSLASGAIGNIRLQTSGYDQTFLARKDRSPAGDDDMYQLFLVNCLWNNDLTGIYDSSQKACVFNFNPSSLFTDTNAPAWDGMSMKKDFPYFVTLQAQGWIWHEGGAVGGLAVDWGAGPAASVFYPQYVNGQSGSEPLRLGITHTNKGPIVLTITGGNASRTYNVDYTDRFALPYSWTSLLSTQFTGGVLTLTDPTVMTNARIYRVRQP